MKKKMLCMVLALLLLPLAAVAEGAENGSFWVRDNYRWEHNMEDIQTLGDAIYLLADNALYRRLPGEAEPVEVLSDLLTDVYVDESDEADKDKPNLSRLFVMDGCLYGFGPMSGQLYRLTDKVGSIALEYIKTIDMSFAKEGDYYFPDCIAMDGTLYLKNVNGENGAIVGLPLTEGEQRSEFEGPASYVPPVCYKDGLLLFSVPCDYEGEGGPVGAQIITLDPKTGESSLLYQTDAMEYSMQLSYDETNDLLYYSSEYAVYRLNLKEGAPQVCAYLPDSIYDGGLMLLSNGTLVIRCYSAVYLRNPALDSISTLFIANEYGSNAHVSVVRDHPEMNIALSNLDLGDLQKLTSTLISGDQQVDVMRINPTYQPVDRLIDKGYLLELNAYPEIMAIAEKMDPRFLAPFQRDGKLYAIPMRVSAQNFTVNMNTWTEMLGLTKEELPVSMEELLDFIQNFSYDYGDMDSVKLTDSWDLRSELLQQMLYMEQALQTRDGVEQLSFNTPRMQTLLQKLDEIDFSELSLVELLGESATDDEYDDFYSNNFVFSLYSSSTPQSMGEDNVDQPLLLRMDEDSDPIIFTDLEALCISARSTQSDQAAVYITSYLNNIDADSTAITLFPDRNESVEDPSFDQTLKDQQEYLAKREAALTAATEENKAEIQDEIKWIKEWLANAETNRYLVTAEQIAAYRQQIAPYLYPVGKSLFSGSDDGASSIRTLLEQYSKKAIDTAAFLKELDNRVRLMTLENQ
ncbi:MAG: extracellular solute-binding protein [Eubacteriales bacterium]|nr:extracellular solute-binding protein [Eubacteriales bacterium]